MSEGGWAALAQGLSDAAGFWFSDQQADQNRRWQEKMFKHRYQYTMQDLEAAGLNPILAAGGMSGGIPSGAQAQAMDAGNPVSTAQQYKYMKEQISQLQTQQAKTAADARLANSQATSNEVIRPWIEKQAQADAASAEAMSRLITTTAGIDDSIYESQAGKFLRIMEKVLPSANSAMNLLPQSRRR